MALLTQRQDLLLFGHEQNCVPTRTSDIGAEEWYTSNAKGSRARGNYGSLDSINVAADTEQYRYSEWAARIL